MKPKIKRPFTTRLTHPSDMLPLDHRCVPLDAASVEALRETIHVALIAAPVTTQYWCDKTDAVLAALGIKRGTP